MIDSFTDMQVTMEVFNYIAIGISVSGSIIVIWGILKTIFWFLENEKNKLLNIKLPNSSGNIRNNFGGYLLLGLDFMLAADIIHTIHNPDLKELYVLAMIVGIRSVISFFLVKEMEISESNKSF